MGGKVSVRAASLTDVGGRERNEDHHGVRDLANGRPLTRGRLSSAGALFIVCDGVGGSAAGHIASKIAVDVIARELTKAPSPATDDQAAQALANAVVTAGEAIRADVDRNPKRKGMGTTATACLVRGSRLLAAQVGDSRAYVLRNGTLTQITKDQDLATQLVEMGQLSKKDAQSPGAPSNVVLQALGSTERLSVALTAVDLKRGDRVLVGSDGLTGPVPDEQIEALTAITDDLEATCSKLVHLAKQRGGRDNITLIVAEFDGAALPEPSEPAEPLAYEFGSDPAALPVLPVSPLYRWRWAVVAALILGIASIGATRAWPKKKTTRPDRPQTAAHAPKPKPTAPATPTQTAATTAPAQQALSSEPTTKAPTPKPPKRKATTRNNTKAAPRVTPAAMPTATPKPAPKPWNEGAPAIGNPFQ